MPDEKPPLTTECFTGSPKTVRTKAQDLKCGDTFMLSERDGVPFRVRCCEDPELKQAHAGVYIRTYRYDGPSENGGHRDTNFTMLDRGDILMVEVKP